MTSGSSRKDYLPFFGVALVWVAVGIGFCSGDALKWMLIFWMLCLLDLIALTLLVSAFVSLAAGSSEKRGARIIQASTWGAIKLACLGIFAAILLQGFTIPSLGLYMGMGTLMIVPLVGGLWWSQRELQHAC
jgi:hypothetical protein